MHDLSLKGGSGLLIVLILVASVAVGVVVFINRDQSLSAAGLDVVLTYTDGTRSKPFQSDPASLSALNLKDLKVVSMSDSRTIMSIEYKPWVSVTYTGTAAKWNATTALQFKTGVNDVDPPVLSTYAIKDTTTPPRSEEKRYFTGVSITNTQIEKWVQGNGETTLFAIATVTVTLEDGSGGKVTSTGKYSSPIRLYVNHETTNLALSITSLQVGVEASKLFDVCFEWSWGC